MTLTFKGKVWQYPGAGGWHFVTIGKAASRNIKEAARLVPKSFGSLHVEAQIGKTKWRTSIFPTKEGTYLLAIKADVRKREGIKTGDTVNIRFTLFIQ